MMVYNASDHQPCEVTAVLVVFMAFYCFCQGSINFMTVYLSVCLFVCLLVGLRKYYYLDLCEKKSEVGSWPSLDFLDFTLGVIRITIRLVTDVWGFLIYYYYVP